MCSPVFVTNATMQRRWLRALLVIVVLPLLAACGAAVQGRAPIKVVATLAPLADWARHVGGDRVEVTQLVPTGVDPRKYTLTDENRRALAQMNVLLYNGLGLEPWLQQAVQAAGPRDLAALELAQYLNPSKPKTIRSPNIGEDGQQDGTREVVIQPATAPSPFLWLNPGPEYAQRAVLLIGDTFSRVDPDQYLDYRRNAERYNGDLENLDQQIRRQVKRWPRLKAGSIDRLAMQSPDLAWYHFARYYGIDLRTPGKLATTSPVLPSTTPLFVNRFTNSDADQTSLSQRPPDGVLNPLSDDQYFTLMQRNVNVIQGGLRRLAREQRETTKSLLAVP